MAFDLAKLLADVRNPNGGEGFRAFVYDDKTGEPIRAGSYVVGNPTVGYGLNLATDPLTESEAAVLLANRIKATATATLVRMPWVGTLSDARQRAIIEMAYNLGESGLSDFDTFLSLMRQGQFAAAADDLATTKWAKQTGNRAIRIISQIRSG